MGNINVQKIIFLSQHTVKRGHGDHHRLPTNHTGLHFLAITLRMSQHILFS